MKAAIKATATMLGSMFMVWGFLHSASFIAAKFGEEWGIAFGFTPAVITCWCFLYIKFKYDGGAAAGARKG